MYTTGLLVMDVKIGLFRAYPSEDIGCPSPAGLSPSMKSKSFDPEGISESLPLGTWNAIAHEPENYYLRLYAHLSLLWVTVALIRTSRSDEVCSPPKNQNL